MAFFHGSSSSSKNHKEYLGHLKSLFEDLPGDAEELLIKFFHSKFPSPNQSTNQNPAVQGQPGTKPSFLDRAKPWAKKVGNMAIDKDLTKIASEALKMVGAASPVLCALVFVGVALERTLAVNPNEEKCLKLVAMMGATIISLRDIRHSNQHVWKNALQIVLENCIFCCGYLEGSRFFKIWNAKPMEQQILEAQQRFNTIMASVNCAGIVEIQQRENYYVVPIDDILETEFTVGLQKPIEEVCKLLSMNEKHMPAVAVIISGLGGMGKTTLASASIQRLAPSINDFKFSRVRFDNTGSRESGRLSYIKMLQQQLVNNLTGMKQEFGNTADGRSKLKEVLQNTSSFIFIDNVNDIDDVEELLPKSLVLNDQTSLRILITSRDRDVRIKVGRICRVEEYQIQRLCSDDAKELLYKIVMDSLDEQFPGEEQKLEEVEESCCGIPILLHLIGTHLREDRSLECYTQIIEELQEGDLSSYSCSHEPIPDILLFVYKRMKPQLQKAFLDICSGFLYILNLYSWLFPKELSNWETLSWMIGENALESLLKKGLVQKKDEEPIVHDILMTMMLDEINKYSIENTVNEINKYSIENTVNKKAIKGIERYVHYEQVSEVDCEDLDLLHSSLRFLCIVDCCSHVRKKCQATFSALRALSVSDSAIPFTSLEGFTNLVRLELVRCPDLTQLPSGICSLRCLRFLSVDGCQELVSFPSDLRNLTSLQLLNISWCSKLKGFLDGNNMPQHLKFLKISGCPDMRIPKDLATLTSLEECCLESYLKNEVEEECYLENEEEWCFRTSKDPVVSFKFPSTSSLKKLYLFGRQFSSRRTLKGDIDKLQNLEELYLEYYDVTHVLGEICRYATNLKKLCLGLCFISKSLPEEISLLTKLHTLDFLECSEVRAYSATFQHLESLCTLRTSGMTDFTPQLCSCLVNLEELELQNCSEEIENLPENINMLSKLKTFKLDNCPGLKNLPQNIKMLSALQTLSLVHCPKLKSLPKDIGMLPNLEALVLADCLELKTLPESIGKLSTLGHLRISKTQMTSLPYSCRNLSNLRNLELDGIPIIEFPPMFCSALQKLAYLTIRNCVELISLPDDLCMLTNLFALTCENIKVKALPQDFANLKRLGFLELRNCGGLPEDAMKIILQLKNLEHLDISTSDALICRWRNLLSNQGIAQTNQIKVFVGNLRRYFWRRALHLWKMKYHSHRLQKEGTL